MKRLLLLLCLAPGLAWAADFYLSNSGAGNLSGSSQANAAANWVNATIEAAVGAGDSIYVCGTVYLSATAIYSESGTSPSHVTVRGDCPGAPGILDGQGAIGPVLQFSEPAQDASYVDLKNITVRNGLQTNGSWLFGITSSGGQTGFNVVQDVVLADGGYTCISIAKHSVTVRNVTASGCGEDGLYAATTVGGIVIDNFTVSDFSRNSTFGDGIQVYDADGSVEIKNSTITWPTGTTSTKGCIIASSSSSTVSITDNTCLATVDQITNHAIQPTAGTAILVEGNYVSGYKAGVTHFIDPVGRTTGTLTVRSNIVNNSLYGFSSNGTVAVAGTFTVVNNSFGSVTRCADFFENVATNIYSNNSCTWDGVASDYAINIDSEPDTFTGNANNYSPDGVTDQFRNQVCGAGNFATLAAYKAGCATIEQASISSTPSFVGGTSPTSAQGFRTACGSPLINAGTYIGPTKDYGNRRFGTPPSIGAWEQGGGDSRCAVTLRTIITPR